MPTSPVQPNHPGCTARGSNNPPLPPNGAPADKTEAAAAPASRSAVLFVTDEIFLPQANGSGSIYAYVAQRYRAAGHDVYCLSFYRDRQQADLATTQVAYQAVFQDTLFLPGWNRGGGGLGYVGMSWRELSRWLTGNVFASHPLLCTANASIADQLISFVLNNKISVIYFHKPHTLLLCEPVLSRLWGQRFILDLHDDFVARDGEYAAAYASVFHALPWRSIMRHFPAMYLRHRFTHTDQTRSRRRELSLLQRCDEVLVASVQEHETYARLGELSGRVRHQPWPCFPAGRPAPRARQMAFHAGFIGADNVMNLDAVLHLRDDILPRVRASRPDFRILLAGTMTHKTAALLRGVPGIETWGRLDDVATFYNAVGVAAVPIRHGTGVSVKAIEALAYGLPLVTTSMGVRGQPVAALMAGNVTIADDPAVFADALLRQAFPPAMDYPQGHSCGEISGPSSHRQDTCHQAGAGGRHPVSSSTNTPLLGISNG